MYSFTFRINRKCKGILLIASCNIAFKISCNSSLAGKAFFSILIKADKYDVMMWIAFIYPSGMETKINDLRGNPPAL